MVHLYWWVVSISGLWIETALSNDIRIAGLKINLVLVLLLLLMLRWNSPFLLFYGFLLGLMTDTLSHSILGVNGLSFLLILILTRWISDWFYDKSIFSTMVFVGVLSLIEGGIALTLLNILEVDFPWNLLFFQVVSPLALIHGLISPLFLFILIRFERFLHIHPEGNSGTPLSY